MGDKKPVSSNTTKATKSVTQSNGTVVETITTTTTDKYADGSSGTRTQVETITKTGGGGSGGVQAPSSESPATSKAPKTENNTDPKWIKEALDEHNALRAKHGAKPLVINQDLNKIAQAWANQIAKKGKMEHSTSGFGENVYWNTETIDGKRPTSQWYSEIKDYNFKKLEGQKGTGHFTQVIWKNTTELGIAMARGDNGYYVVANYYPPGNFIGKYPDNIQP